VPVPVSDVDRAKAFYTEKLGFKLEVDTQVEGVGRFAQLTPPGSACSIAIGLDIKTMPPGSTQGLLLIVSDPRRARGADRASC
jgi:catechol 2,3-dioxygenase-like lactoylglutathione lyase family enzyme